MTADSPWFAHYEEDVSHTVEIPAIPVQQLLVNAAAEYPHHTAVRLPLRYLPLGTRIEAKLSYKELDTFSDRFAAALAALGVHKGSRVAIMLPNLPQQLVAYFGVLKAGAIVVNTNPTYPSHELEPLLRSTGVALDHPNYAVLSFAGTVKNFTEPSPMVLTIILGANGRAFSGVNPDVKLAIFQNGSISFTDLPVTNVAPYSPDFKLNEAYRFSGEWRCGTN